MTKLVRLRGGGPDMAVVGWSRLGYTCEWFEEGRCRRCVYPRSALDTVYRIWFYLKDISP